MTRSGVFKRTLVIALASVVILAGLLVGGVRLIDHLMPSYRQALGERIGRRIDADVRIDAIELRWQWRGPLLELADVRVTRHGFDQPAIHVRKLGLHFSFAELVEGKRLPDSLLLDQPRLAVRRSDNGRPQIVNWSRPNDPPLDWATVNDALGMLRSIQIVDADVTLFDPSLPDGHARSDSLDASLARDGGGYAWQFDASGPDWLGKASSSGRFSGRLPRVDTADFKFSVAGIDALAVARANDLLDDDLAARLAGGEAAVEIEGRWRNRQLVSATAMIDTATLKDRGDKTTLLPALSTTIKAADIPAAAQPASGGDDFSFVVSDLRGNIDGLDRFSLSGAVDMDEPRLRVDARHLPVPVALRLARLRYVRLAQTDISAAVDDLTFAAGADTPARLSFGFTGLSIDDPALSVGPIAGSYHQRGGLHRLRLSAADGTLQARRWLRGALPLDGLGGELSWQRDQDAWQIEARKLALTSQGAHVTADGRIRLPRDGVLELDIDARASAADVTALLAHVPQAADLPNDKLRDWLPKAITAGTLDSAHLQISGALDRFPFAEPRKNERFHLELTGHSVDVKYKPEWPSLDNARGTLTLDGDELRLDVASAEMLGVGLGPATARMANVREPVLKIDGKATGARVEKMLAFLVQSPLRDRFTKVVEALELRGPADLALDLSVPLKPELGDVEFAGDVQARGVSLRQDALAGPITDIHGQLYFDSDGLRAQGLKGNLLGVTLSTDLVPAPGKRQRIVSRARLHLPHDRKALSRYMPDRWLDHARGATDFTVDFEVARSGDVSDIDLRSDLSGMALGLPDPLAKPAGRAAPLAITLAGDASRVHIDYDRRMQVAVRQKDGHVQRVQARFNDTTRQPPDRDGVWIGGHAKSVDGLGWFKLVRNQLAAADKRSDNGRGDPGLAFTGGDLRIGELDLGNRYFRNAHLRAQTMAARPGWRIDFEGPDTQGQVTWTQPDGGNTNIAGNLARVAIHTRERQPEAVPDDADPVIWKDVDPQGFPRLDLFVKHVLVDNTDFGRAQVKASAQPNGWQLDRFQLDDGAMAGWATGRWMRDNGRTSASAQTHFAGHGLSQLLRSLGYAATARAEDARVHARLNVAPNPNGLDLRALDGSVELALDDGTFIAVEPGAGRVLGLFNLYVLPRRLRLDFRDVVDEGLAFDKVRADFRIENGNAYSDNVRIKTPSSEVRMSGRIGLAARDYDQRVTITPKVGSGVTIASTVLGGPLVGAAVFAMQELFKKPIEKFSSIAYTLKGSWDDPRIEEPSARE